ncbi:hypothetical protein FRB94_009243 [Tulasnella sp. JGI-2019a]|nr:hypothetical protein FRB94_009243 [Tulasnella sp. JGI-2019a]KAG9030557.1 hypothetical protein FRB95_003818 [Tulasnella sp. JGI-2019a]
MEERARKTGMTTGPPVIPDSLRSYIVKHSPTSSSYNTASKLNPFLDKEVLVLSGASDRLVPWSHSEPFIDALVVGDKGRKKVVLQEGAGHELTADMHIEAATFAWEWIAKKSASTPRL